VLSSNPNFIIVNRLQATRLIWAVQIIEVPVGIIEVWIIEVWIMEMPDNRGQDKGGSTVLQ